MTLLAVLHSRTLLSAPPVSRTDGEACAPPADVYETASAVVVELELPATAPADVRIVVDAGVLVVQGVKGPTVPPAARADLARFVCMERLDGPFRRALRLPCPVDAGRGRARLEQGVLTIVLPRLDR